MEVGPVAVEHGAVEPGPVIAIAAGVDGEPLTDGGIAGRVVQPSGAPMRARPSSNEPLKIRFPLSARQVAATPRRTTAERIERLMRASRVRFRPTGWNGRAVLDTP
jgi:hypothetical protein